jgi:HPt (histidine-containing phosphotransfer) domain-containing protein
MREALAHNAFDELRRSAHQLKGAGGGYGYPSITEVARSLETAALGGDPEAAALALAGLAGLCRAAARGGAARIDERNMTE